MAIHMESRIAGAPLRPPRLKAGDVVGVVAPASPFDRGAFEKGLAVLAGMGLEVRLAEGLFARRGFLAGDDAQRARQVNDFIHDPDVRAIVCARGGYGSMRILARLDYAALARRPVALTGFSDITALHAAVYARCGLVTFHAPVVTSLGKGGERSRRSFQAALFSGAACVLTAERPQVLRAGTARGPVAGGNLALLAALAGTPYFPDLRGHILFLEDVTEQPYRIDRMLTQLKLAGCLSGLAGVALGRFDRCGLQEEVYAVAADAFADAGIPVLGGFEVGHGGENLTFPLGLPARLDTSFGTLAWERAGTSARGRP